MIKSANNYPVSQIFDIEAGVVYEILRYKRGYINAELATAEAWSVAQIDARTTTLVDQVMRLFSLTGDTAC